MSIHTLKVEGCQKEIRFWTDLAQTEAEAIAQLKNVASLPWVFHHVAVMPDCHVGRGCTVGSVIAMRNALSPATVGVDIGCGMMAVRTSLRASDLPDNLESLRASIEAAIPVGFNAHESWAPMRPDLSHEVSQHMRQFNGLDAGVQMLGIKAAKQMGTLGGGNHFIELCLGEDELCDACNGQGQILDYGGPFDCGHCTDGKVEPPVWLMLHSGSRNIGKCLAEIHIERAQKLAHNATLPDPDLAVFLAGTPEMEAYRNDLFWAQRYALLNRRTMFGLLKGALRAAFPFSATAHLIKYDEPIECHHNYVNAETHFGEEVLVTRKGAISARQGELGVIPGSMGTASYIVRGLGNPDSFHSASHGAGRRMSRGAARRKFTIEDLKTQTSGVCCRKDAEVVDEIPGAYKDIDEVMAHQSDLVEIVTKIKQVLCVKGN